MTRAGASFGTFPTGPGKLKHAQQVLHRDLFDVETLLAEALGSAEEATAEMRELAHGTCRRCIRRATA